MSPIPRRSLEVLHKELDDCRACGTVVGPVVHGPPVHSPVLLIGQAPGPHEGKFGRPFAWTAGKTLFRWFEEAIGEDEASFRSHVYMAAVLRCFPGKAKGGGDRRPGPQEIASCRPFLERETAILKPQLVLPVGTLAIEQVTGHKGPLVEVIGKALRVDYHGHSVDVICLPHPSGASTWHRMTPGKELLQETLSLIAVHPAMKKAFA
jgi:uracil-DNA glycosylase